MIEIRQTREFRAWIDGLADKRGKAKILVRIDRLALGNAGDVNAIGSGLSELRIHFGPGYRVYFMQRGKTLIILLCGGDKSSQARNIRDAQRLAENFEE